jgi:hypothetical protein
MGEASAGVEFASKSKSKDDSCARFEASAQEVLSSPLFPALIAIGADRQLEGRLRAGLKRAAALKLRRSGELIAYLMLERELGASFVAAGGKHAAAAALRDRRQPPAARLSTALRVAGRPELALVGACFDACGRFRSVGYGDRTAVRPGDLVVLPDGLMVEVASTTIGGTRLASSIELRLRAAKEEARLTVRASESQAWRNVMLSVLEGSGAAARLVVEEWDAERSARGLKFKRAVQLEVGQVARATDGLVLGPKRITAEPPFALLAMKRGKAERELWVKPPPAGKSAEPIAWLDYLVYLRAIALRGYPRRSSVELLVEKPRESVIEASYDARFTLKREETARFPDGMRLTFLGARRRELARGGSVAYLQLRLSVGRTTEEARFELMEPGRGWTRTLTWRGYRVQLPGDRDRETAMEFLVTK